MRWLPRTLGCDMSRTDLSRREIAVLQLLADGANTHEVATTLHLGERTVKSVVQDLKVRCELRNRVHMVAFALRNGLIR